MTYYILISCILYLLFYPRVVYGWERAQFWCIGILTDRDLHSIIIFPFPFFGIKFSYIPLYRWYLNVWKYRHVDPEVCCCGERMGHGGSICHHGGCRSMKEYTITREMEGL